MESAKALQAFRDGTGDAYDFSGAMILEDAIDDIRLLRIMAEAYVGVDKRYRKK